MATPVMAGGAKESNSYGSGRARQANIKGLFLFGSIKKPLMEFSSTPLW